MTRSELLSEIVIEIIVRLDTLRNVIIQPNNECSKVIDDEIVFLEKILRKYNQNL